MKSAVSKRTEPAAQLRGVLGIQNFAPTIFPWRYCTVTVGFCATWPLSHPWSGAFWAEAAMVFTRIALQAPCSHGPALDLSRIFRLAPIKIPAMCPGQRCAERFARAGVRFDDARCVALGPRAEYWRASSRPSGAAGRGITPVPDDTVR